MPLITLDIPQNKMPLVKDFMQVIGLKEKTLKTGQTAYYTQGHPSSRQNLPNFTVSSTKGWEFFINELEFE